MKSEVINEYDHMLFRTHGLYSDTKRNICKPKAISLMADHRVSSWAPRLFQVVVLCHLGAQLIGKLFFVGLLYRPVSDRFSPRKFRVFHIVFESVANRI